MAETIRDHSTYNCYILSLVLFHLLPSDLGCTEIVAVKLTVKSNFQRWDFSPVLVSSQVFWQRDGKDAIKNCFPDAIVNHHHNPLLIKDG